MSLPSQSGSIDGKNWKKYCLFSKVFIESIVEHKPAAIMTGNTYGKMLKLTTWGESHGKAVGAVLDGVPAGLPIEKEDIQKDLNRRRPGKSKVETSRDEKDQVQILSGIFQGKTVGTPIQMLVENRDVKSKSYEKRKMKPRPGHADLTYKQKYTHVDYRGGGRSSGRETVGRVAGGAIAKKLIENNDTEVLSHVIKVADVGLEEQPNIEEIRKIPEENKMRCADSDVAERMEERVIEISEKGDSAGGIVEIMALGVPSGLGEPVFDKIDAEISKALMSIGSVKGVEIGAGFEATDMLGSEFNDDYRYEGENVVTDTNNAGGILGGISNGQPIFARMAVKPTPSISKTQESVNLESGEEIEMGLEGRFDPTICPRVAPVGEAMLALVLADMMLRAGEINPDSLEVVK